MCDDDMLKVQAGTITDLWGDRLVGDKASLNPGE